MYSLTPSQAKSCVEICMKAHLVPFLISSPGMGKSSLVREIADEYGLKLIDCRLSSMEPTDLVGLPWIQDGKARFNPYEMFPIKETPIPKGYEGFLLFLDEFNSASRAVQAAAYRVILDREIGQHKLHSHCFVVAAGNKTSDNAITNPLSTAMLSRVIHLHMDISFEDWRDNFAIPQKIDERVISYLSAFPDKLMQFDPDREDETFACPRTWDFVSQLIQASGGKVNNELIPLLSGAITEEHAVAFVQFCKVYKDLISIEDIEKNPLIPPPKDHATLWATIIHLINRTTVKNLDSVLKFIDQVPASFKIVYVRSIKKLYADIVMKPEFIKFVQNIGDYCFGD